jgi:hypothetical protein
MRLGRRNEALKPIWDKARPCRRQEPSPCAVVCVLELALRIVGATTKHVGPTSPTNQSRRPHSVPAREAPRGDRSAVTECAWPLPSGDVPQPECRKVVTRA